jgi:hypothetical protein
MRKLREWEHCVFLRRVEKVARERRIVATAEQSHCVEWQSGIGEAAQWPRWHRRLKSANAPDGL